MGCIRRDCTVAWELGDQNWAGAFHKTSKAVLQLVVRTTLFIVLANRTPQLDVSAVVRSEG